MLRTKLVRSDVKVLDEASGRISAVVSTESRDRDGDIVRQSGWDLDHFKRHPVLLSSHNYLSLRNIIGEWESMEIKGKRLVGTARYFVGEGNDEADWAFNLAKHGLGAFSVGFIPDMDAAKELKSDGLFPNFEFTKQELLEVSQVTIPSNPDAVQRSYNPHPMVKELAAELECSGLCETAAKVAVASHDEGTAPRTQDWSAPSLDDFTDEAWDDLSDAEKNRIARHFVWSDSGFPPENFSDLGGPHHEPAREGVGRAVWRAVSSGRMAQAPWYDDAGVRRHLGRHYRQFDEEPPWEREAAEARDAVDVEAVADAVVERLLPRLQEEVERQVGEAVEAHQTEPQEHRAVTLSFKSPDWESIIGDLFSEYQEGNHVSQG